MTEPVVLEYQPVSEVGSQTTAIEVMQGVGASVPVLMGSEHHTGWPLEILLQVLVAELRAKNDKIGGKPGDVAAKIVANNSAIMLMLGQCQRLQEETLHALDTIAPNPGPAGPPRL